MIIFGPLWLVATIWLVVWLINKGTQPKCWYCKACRQPVVRLTPVCPNCQRAISWPDENLPRPSRHIFLKTVVVMLGVFVLLMVITTIHGK